MEYIILTGMSGAGKSQAANTLEDVGFYCVDNMPAQLITQFSQVYSQLKSKSTRVAFVIDVRGEQGFATLIEQVEALRREGNQVKTVFLDCDDPVLITRYKETRRIHPLSALSGMSMPEALKAEREMLEDLKACADFQINTSKLTVLQLRSEIIALSQSAQRGEMVVTCVSFGFKYGIPTEADLVFDVRCFPNPFYVPILKEKTGLDREVADFVFDSPEVTEYLQRQFDLLDFMIPQYRREGKSQLIIATGCTGGKHRSVALSERMANHFRQAGANVTVIHRDIHKI